MRILICVLLAVLIFPAFSLASPDGVTTLTATGGFKLATTNSSGPHLVEALGDGDFTIVIISSVDGSGASPNTVRRQWPDGVFGGSAIPGRSGFPLQFDTKGDRVDSVYVVFNGASKVDLIWQND